MAYTIASIPQIFRAIFVAFLAVLMVRVTYPVANYILSIFPDGQMKVVAYFAYYFIIVTVMWVFVWLVILKPDNMQIKTTLETN